MKYRLSAQILGDKPLNETTINNKGDTPLNEKNIRLTPVILSRYKRVHWEQIRNKVEMPQAFSSKFPRRKASNNDP